MGWITVYIRGKSGFEQDVLDKLNGSDFPFMPGSSYEKGLMLCWIPDQKTVRSFKQVIGSNPLTLDCLLSISLQVSSALAAAHARWTRSGRPEAACARHAEQQAAGG